MKCLRCGHCCKNYAVVIVDDPEKGISEGNLIVHKGDGTPCKHLRGDEPGKHSCAIHHYPWFAETPCGQFTQVESSPNDNCRLGQFILALTEEETAI